MNDQKQVFVFTNGSYESSDQRPMNDQNRNLCLPMVVMQLQYSLYSAEKIYWNMSSRVEQQKKNVWLIIIHHLLLCTLKLLPFF